MKFKVSSLTHHPKNKEIYILSSIDELMESISEVGLLQSIIIDQHQQIISGNRRFESIKRLGWKEVEVEVWNGTVANLTLMALSSSAPEILLAAVETCALTFQAGDLGPGTIVGLSCFQFVVCC